MGSFERACVFDSTGRSDLAVPLYREALERGLTAERRRRAVIQLASSLRNIGRADESVALLTAELDAETDELDDAVRAFLALALVEVGRDARRSRTRSPRSRRTFRGTSDRSRATPRTSSRLRGALWHATSRHPSAINATPATTSAAPPRRAGPTRSPASGAARNAAMSTLVSRTDATAAADARSSAARTSA